MNRPLSFVIARPQAEAIQDGSHPLWIAARLRRSQ